MKLERYLSNGVNSFSFSPIVKDGIIQTVDLFQQLYDRVTHLPKPLSEKHKADLSYSFVSSLVSSLTSEAINHAFEKNMLNIGVTGGVSYNIPIMEMIESQVKKNDLSLLVHHRIPNGDGGISAGQNVLAGHLL
jgi:hydrogenase maturation protein HypF